MSILPRRILVVGPSWVGDMVISHTLYRTLAQQRPGVVIDVLAPAWSAPLLARMPEVRRVVAMPVGHGEIGLAQRRRLGRELRSAAYQQAIVLPNSFKSALVPWFAGIEQRTGWLGELRYGLLNDRRRLDPVALPSLAQRFAQLGLPAEAAPVAQLPLPVLVSDPGQAAATLNRLGLAAHRPLLALCPGAAFGSAKRWPARHFAEIAVHYLKLGWQVVLLGSRTDQSVCAQLSQACGSSPDLFDLSGRTSLAEAIDLLSQSRLVVSNDSGLMHVAAALNRPLLAIYGPTSPNYTPPMSDRARVLAANIDCAPCFARECPLGHQRCMTEIQPQQVLARLDAMRDQSA